MAPRLLTPTPSMKATPTPRGHTGHPTGTPRGVGTADTLTRPHRALTEPSLSPDPQQRGTPS